MEAKLPRNLGMELVRATESAALVAGQWIGLGNPFEADRAASQAMANVLETVRIDGRIVLGEEDKPGHDLPLHSEQAVGSGEGPAVDIVVDPVDGRQQLAQGFPGAISVAAIAPRGAIWRPPHAIYMEKIIVDGTVAPYLVDECMDAPAAWTLSLVARAKGMKVNNLTVFVLDRPRHADLVAEIRAAGAHVMLRPDGDIAGALMVCTPLSGVDILMGTGGIPEGLLAACAVKSLGGTLLGRLDPQDQQEKDAIRNTGYDLGTIFDTDDLVKSDQIFFTATGITDGPVLKGVIYHGEKADTNSLILRCETGTRRMIQAEHRLGKWIELNS
ncbi:MAG: class II fructose-bisphosphatase [Chloroflexota bacterium]